MSKDELLALIDELIRPVTKPDTDCETMIRQLKEIGFGKGFDLWSYLDYEYGENAKSELKALYFRLYKGYKAKC